MKDNSPNKSLPGAHLEPQNSAHPPVNTIEDVIVFKMARAVGISHRIGQNFTESMFGLSLNEWRLMALITIHGPIRAGDLAELMLMDKSQLSRIIRMLTKKELVQSMPDKNDARAVALQVTEKAEELHTVMLAEAERRSKIFFGELSGAELLELNRLIEKITVNGMAAMQRLEDNQDD
jgi:DNA-binding MarR family transcriptional regulator